MGAWKADVERFLIANEGKVSRERLTLIRIYEEVRSLGYDGSYDTVRRYAKAWAKSRGAVTTEAYVPLYYAPCEAYQFDWSHEIILINGVTTTVEGGTCPALPQPYDVCPSLYARKPGNGVRRARQGLRLLPWHLHAWHLRQSMDASRAR